MTNEEMLQAIRNDIADVKAALHQEIAASSAELRQEIAASSAELRQEIATSNAELRQEIAASNAELRQEIAASNAELRQEISASEQRAVDQATHNMRVLIESDINPKMNLILEGISAINQRLSNSPTQEELEEQNDRLQLLERVVARHSRDIAELKQAK